MNFTKKLYQPEPLLIKTITQQWWYQGQWQNLQPRTSNYKNTALTIKTMVIKQGIRCRQSALKLLY
jgi:hypothetical protein